MKTYKFNNGETRLESQMSDGNDFRLSCILWGCFCENTGEPLPFIVSETTKEELLLEKQRLAAIQEEFEEVTERNKRISLGNEKVARATNINEFMNAYL